MARSRLAYRAGLFFMSEMKKSTDAPADISGVFKFDTCNSFISSLFLLQQNYLAIAVAYKSATAPVQKHGWHDAIEPHNNVGDVCKKINLINRIIHGESRLLQSCYCFVQQLCVVKLCGNWNFENCETHLFKFHFLRQINYNALNEDLS
jgi:hypothetical protein